MPNTYRDLERMTADMKNSSLPSSLSLLHASLTNGGNDNVSSSSSSSETGHGNSHVSLPDKTRMSSSLSEIKLCKDETSEVQSFSKGHLLSLPNIVSLSPEVDNSSNEESSQTTLTSTVIPSTITQNRAKVDQSLPENDQMPSSIHSRTIQISTVQSKLTENSIHNGIDTLPLQPEKTAEVLLPPSPLNGSAIKSANGKMNLAVELAPYPVEAEELPTVLPLVNDSQQLSDIKESSQNPPLPVHVKMKISVGDDEVFEEERPSVFKDHFSEDEGSPPPLPVKNERTIVPPPPPEESDDKESPPLPIKKVTDTTPVVVPVSGQGEPKHGIPPPSLMQDSDDDLAPPLPVKKQSKEENVSVEENRVPEARPIQSLPLSKVASDSTSSVVSVPSATGSPTAKRQPPVPPRRTVSAIAPPSRSVESDSNSPPPPLPKRKILIPSPPPPVSNSDSHSEDDGRFVYKRSLVAVKSVPLQGDSYLSSGNILLSRSKDSMETSDSSDDDDYHIHSNTKIISQPSVDDDKIALSSTPVIPDAAIGKNSIAKVNNVLPSLPSQKRVPPPVKQQLSSKVSSPPTLPQPLSTPPPSQIGLPSEQMKQQVLMRISCVCVCLCIPTYVSACVSACVCLHVRVQKHGWVWHALSVISPTCNSICLVLLSKDSITSMYSKVGLPPSQKTTHKVL